MSGGRVEGADFVGFHTKVCVECGKRLSPKSEYTVTGHLKTYSGLSIAAAWCNTDCINKARAERQPVNGYYGPWHTSHGVRVELDD